MIARCGPPGPSDASPTLLHTDKHAAIHHEHIYVNVKSVPRCRVGRARRGPEASGLYDYDRGADAIAVGESGGAWTEGSDRSDGPGRRVPEWAQPQAAVLPSDCRTARCHAVRGRVYKKMCTIMGRFARTVRKGLSLHMVRVNVGLLLSVESHIYI